MDDQSFNVDDLFGDSDQVALPSLAIPPVKGLARRLDELSVNGCCQKIAWSKNGCLAYISPDEYTIHLKVFSRDPATGKWDLGKETSLEIPHEFEGLRFVHLSWSNLGNDLVVVDSAGHLLMFTSQYALERMVFMRPDQSHHDLEMDGVVGMHWFGVLPYAQKNMIVWSAKGKGDNWSFRTASHVFQDAHHPLDGRVALIYLKRFGDLRLRFQQGDSSWQEVSTEVSVMASSCEAFSHAAFASNGDNTLLLAAYDISGRLHLYRIEAKWNVPAKTSQPIKNFDKPELVITALDIEHACYPINSAQTGENGGPSSKLRIHAQLTHLNFLPKTPEQNDGSFPTIQAIFSTPPNIVSFDHTQAPQNPCSIVVRWEVHQLQRNELHSSLDFVTSKRKSVSSVGTREAFVLKRMADMVLHSVVLDFHSLWYSMTLAFCYSDGTLELRKRSTMDVISPNYDTETVSSLAQAGFSYSAHEPSLHTALSPNHTIAVCMQQDGTVKLRSMEYTYGSLASDDDRDPRHDAALAALVSQTASASNQYFSSDDIFSIMPPLSDRRKASFIHLKFQATHVNLDCGMDDQNTNHLMLLGRSPYFSRTLSAAHLLGHSGPTTRSVTSKAAWILLNIKYITQAFTTIIRMHASPHSGKLEQSNLQPPLVQQVVGMSRWIHSFMVYLLDELFQLGLKIRQLTYDAQHTPGATSFSLATMPRADLEALIQELNTPVLAVMLSSFPRLMMKTWSQGLSWLQRSSQNMATSAPNVELRRLYAPLYQTFTDAPVHWRIFSDMVSELHVAVRSVYKSRGLDEAQRNRVEREVLLGGIPDILLPVAKWIIGEYLWGKAPQAPDTAGEQSQSQSQQQQQQPKSLSDRVEVCKIYFHDTTWLGISDTKPARNFHRTRIVDVAQKLVIRGVGAQLPATALAALSERPLRRCTRCAAYMEDVVPGMPGYGGQHAQWLLQMAKHCICGNAWTLVENPVASGR